MLFLAFVMLNDHGISGHVFLISGHVFLISGHVGPPKIASILSGKNDHNSYQPHNFSKIRLLYIAILEFD